MDKTFRVRHGVFAPSPVSRDALPPPQTTPIKTGHYVDRKGMPCGRLSSTARPCTPVSTSSAGQPQKVTLARLPCCPWRKITRQRENFSRAGFVEPADAHQGSLNHFPSGPHPRGATICGFMEREWQRRLRSDIRCFPHTLEFGHVHQHLPRRLHPETHGGAHHRLPGERIFPASESGGKPHAVQTLRENRCAIALAAPRDGACQQLPELNDRQLDTALDNARADSVASETGRVVDVELLHEMLAMLLDRLHSDAECRRGLFVGLPFGD